MVNLRPYTARLSAKLKGVDVAGSPAAVAVAPAPAPRVASAQFTETLGALHVDFDVDTDQGATAAGKAMDIK